LTQLIERVAREKADLGIAFDGDGDRIGVIDGKGRILWGDQLLVLLAEKCCASGRGRSSSPTSRPASAVRPDCGAGGQPLMWRTGHSLIKTKMAEVGAPLAGEMSGHIFIGDHYYGFDDALYAASACCRSSPAGPTRLWPTVTTSCRSCSIRRNCASIAPTSANSR